MERRALWGRLFLLGALIASLFIANQFPIGQQITLGLGQLLYAVKAPVRWLDDASLWLQERGTLQDELIEARETLSQRSYLTQQNQSLREENHRLRLLLHITDTQGYQWRVAQVLGRSPEKKSQHLILQAEANRDDVVVASSGLVGLVDQSHDNTAVVRTILDGSLAIPVTLKNSSLAALVRGAGDHLSVDFVPIRMAPKVGDVLLTSGAGGVFPPGLPVASVTSIEPVAGRIFARVKATPTAHWQRDNWLAIASQKTIPHQP